ncbi:MAG: class I SAM-dependent methyltransferase [Gammaproteobacteria bacterium]
MSLELPAPDAAAQAHSDALHEFIAQTIEQAGGRITFARYMEMALYAPAQGYYSAGTAKFGPAGDFTTAPEISPLFGMTVAHAALETLRELDPAEAVVLELGAGSGALAAAFLGHLDAHDALPREYWILEVSGDLKARQREALGALPEHIAGRVRWLEALPQMPFKGVVIANEVLDALPVERFEVQADGGVKTAWVEVHDGAFVQVFDKAAPEVRTELLSLMDECRVAGAPLPAGYVSEFCPGARAFAFTLGHCLAQGLVLLSDYGGSRAEIYRPERHDGTLLCHYRHRAHADPFFLPGLQDITAWVDFTGIADAAIDAGLKLSGYTTQAHFLLAGGLDQTLSAALAATPERAAQLQSEAKTLTLPGEMGERFKFMALSRDLTRPVSGFALRDLSVSLAMAT